MSISKYSALSLSLLLCLSSCYQRPESSETSEDAASAVETESPSQTVTTDDTTKETTNQTTTRAVTENEKKSYDYADISFLGSTYYSLKSEQIPDLSDAVNALKPVKFDDFTVISKSPEWEIGVYNSDSYEKYKRILTDKGPYIKDMHMNLYEDSPEITRFIAENYPRANNPGTATEEEYFTVECSEPKTEDEYVDAAIKCTEAWLKSLQSEDTDIYYRNKDFEIVRDDGFSQKCNYLSCGTVNGKKEFVVEICFTAEGCGKNSFYDDYYQEGRYTEAGTFWSGQYICGRYRWEDGKCTLIKMDTRDGSNAMQKGLNGIQSGEYKNFYEFARRSDYQQALEESFVPEGEYTVSKNLTLTEDGKPINIDIYSNSIYGEDENSYKAIWDERAYINKVATYSTGLYFTDGGTGHMPDILPKEFSLTFDNYDGDANPDFCCRYDNDQDGTFYVLESVQTDGRIFNLSGRAFEGGIYIAGCKDPSPRLQKTDDIAYVGWKKDENGYYPTDSNGNMTELPELNMYSDRYYLPNDLKLYSEDENKVTCFLWNNTAEDITTDGIYSVEIMKDGEWKSVAEGLPVSSVTVKPRRYAEITYDISAVKERFDGLYRIVQKSGELTAGGKFRLAGKEMQNISARAADIYKGASCGRIELRFNGMEPTELTSAYITDGNKKYDLVLNKIDVDKYVFIGAELPESPGKYKLVLNDSAECSITVKEYDAKSVK